MRIVSLLSVMVTIGLGHHFVINCHQVKGAYSESLWTQAFPISLSYTGQAMLVKEYEFSKKFKGQKNKTQSIS